MSGWCCWCLNNLSPSKVCDIAFHIAVRMYWPLLIALLSFSSFFLIRFTVKFQRTLDISSWNGIYNLQGLGGDNFHSYIDRGTRQRWEPTLLIGWNSIYWQTLRSEIYSSVLVNLFFEFLKLVRYFFETNLTLSTFL